MATEKCQECGGDLNWLGRCPTDTRPRRWLRIIAALAIYALVPILTGCVTTDVRREINIKPKPLVEALTRWAELTGYQIVVPNEPGCERLSGQAKGMDAKATLDQLLEGTEITYRWLNERTVAIRCPE